MTVGFINKISVLWVILLLWRMFIPFQACAQKILSTSDSKRPVWLADKTPRPANATFYYQIAEGEHPDLEEAKRSCLINLSTFIKQTNRVVSETKSEIKVDNDNRGQRESENYRFTYIVKGEEVSVTFHKEDEYWEYVLYSNGEHAYRCYTLFAVGVAKGRADFVPLTFSRKYGARGVWRSMIIPGWGQMYKGSAVKGGCILGGEALLVGGILISENLRSSYVKKMHEDPKHLKTYNTKADNWRNTRNACIGGAAALYVYNLIDALVANGRKRSFVRRSHFVLSPTLNTDCNGVAFAFNF